MTTLDYIILAVAAVFLLYQLLNTVRFWTTTVIRGKTPMKLASTMILLLLFALAFWRAGGFSGSLGTRWPIFAILLALCLVYGLSGSGLSRTGAFAGGRYIAFDRAAYYSVDDPDGETPTLHVSRMTRECIIRLTRPQLEEAMLLLKGAGVPTAREFHNKVEETTARRQNRRKKK
ncbi:MAG: hypothetical protein II028_08890 [Clostridia bacterium]|nr:hypothetical protein [Clostridia bacterium]